MRCSNPRDVICPKKREPSGKAFAEWGQCVFRKIAPLDLIQGWIPVLRPDFARAIRPARGIAAAAIVVDVSWGSFVTAISATAGLLVANWVAPRV
jgi:hypothetical protein